MQATCLLILGIVIELGGLLAHSPTMASAAGAQSVSTGTNHSCFIEAGGAAYCMGYNAYGQLGNNTLVDSSVPVLVGGSHIFASISVGDIHSCGVTTTDELWCWGNAGSGRLGDSQSSTNRKLPVQIAAGTSWASVSAGNATTCAITKTTSLLYCWGYNTYGSIGRGDTVSPQTSPLQIGSGTWLKVSVSVGDSVNGNGRATVCGLTSGFLIQCWGYNYYGQVGNSTTGTAQTSPVTVTTTGFTQFSDVAVGDDFACGIRKDNSTGYCWGFNTEKQLGDGTLVNKTVPTLIPSSPSFTSLSAGGRYMCGLVSTTNYCWGGDSGGAVGDGTNTMRSVPTAATGSWTQIDMGEKAGCGVNSSSQLYCWGYNNYGQLGDGTTISRYLPRAVSAGSVRFGVKDAVSGVNESAGSIVLTVERLGTRTGAVTVDYATADGTAVAGSNYTSTSGTLSFADTEFAKTITIPITNDGSSNATRNFTLTISNPTGGTLDSQVTTTVSIYDDDSAHPVVSTGTNTNCYITSSAGGDMYCMGNNADGELGDTTAVNKTVPTLVTGGKKWISLSVGDVQTCGITVERDAYCWGQGGSGRLGDGASSTRYAPVLVGGSLKWASLDTGNATTCGITLSGNGLCWGYGYYGTVGDGSATANTDYVYHPNPTGLNTSALFSKISISSGDSVNGNGRAVACGLTTTNLVQCWGYNYYGQVGNNTTGTGVTSPTTVTTTGFTAFSDVATGNDFSCGIRQDNSAAYCWGFNTQKQLGDGTLVNKSVPTAVTSSPSLSSLRAGGRYMCGTVSTTIYCWGGDSSGAVGDGTNTMRSTPTTATGSWAQFDTADKTACGVNASDQIYCWGYNGYGQYGDGSTVTRYTPRAINFGSARFDVTGATSGIGGGVSGVNESAGSVVVTVERLGSRSGAVTVDYATSNGSATSGTDYTGVSGTLSFADTEYTKSVTININNDGSSNGTRNFTFALSNPSGGTALQTPSSSTVSIYDDDAARPAVSVGTNHMCYITSTAGGDMYCSGLNADGQLGDTTTVNKTVSTLVTGGKKWIAVSAGDTQTCGLTVDRDAYCWGQGGSGRLGYGGASSQSTPSLVGGNLKWLNLESGNATTCGVTVNNTGLCWGYGYYGTVGDGSATANTDYVYHYNPTGLNTTASFNKISISGGDSVNGNGRAVACGLTTTNLVQCWGYNYYGQVGNSTTGTGVTSPTTVTTTGFTQFSDVSNGDDFSCGIRQDNSAAYCWGFNAQRQLGDGTVVNKSVPTVVTSSPSFGSISGGGRYVCGLISTTNYCWGGDSAGANGDGTDALRSTPTAGVGTWAQVSTGEKTACGVSTSNVIYCWGYNLYGQYGDGTTIGRFVPRVINYGSARFAVKSSITGVNESAGSVVLTVERLGTRTGAVTVDYATSNGTAAAGTNYTSTSGTLSFADTEYVKTVSIPITDDGSSNATRTLTFTLSNPSGGTSLDSPSSATVSIYDDDSAKPTTAVGSNHSCYLTTTAGGDIYCSGLNADGELGDTTTTDKTVPTLVTGGKKWIALSAGDTHTCGLTVDHDLYCWGQGGSGRLGYGGASSQSTPSLVSGNLKWSTVDAGDAATCGTTMANVAMCWGYGYYGTIGDTSATANTDYVYHYDPQAIASSYSFTKISISPGDSTNGNGRSVACGLTTTNLIQCWGYNYNGQAGINTSGNYFSTPTTVTTTGFTQFSDVGAGDDHACGIRMDNSLPYCWGYNAYGSLGDGTWVDKLVPTAVSTSQTMTSITLGGTHVCGMSAANYVYCWGAGSTGAQGDNLDTHRTVPALAAGFTTWSQIEAGDASTCGLNLSSTLYCWGANTNGGLGDGTTVSRFLPRLVSVGASHYGFTSSATSVNEAAGTVTVTVERTGSSAAAVSVNWATANGTAIAGTNYTANSGTLSFGAGVKSLTATVTIANDNVVNAARNFTIALSSPSAGTTIDNGTITVTINDEDGAVPVVSTGHTSCYLLSTAGSQAYCWGYNANGSVGDGTTVAKTAPTAIGGALRFTSISNGDNTTCAVATTYDLYCWGYNGWYQLGDGTGTARTSPTLVVGFQQWKSVSVGGNTVCGVTLSNKAFCWGYNNYGELGMGSPATSARSRPGAVNSGLDNWTSVSTGEQYAFSQGGACGLQVGGAAYCWGYNSNGEVGNNSTTAARAPVQVSAGTTFKSITRGGYGACAITSADLLQCWGSSAQAQVGDTFTTTRKLPVSVSVGGNTYIAETSGNLHNCGITTTNAGYCWGDNAYGQIGDNNTPTDRTSPTTAIVNSKKWRQLQAGYQQTCGVTLDNFIYCWGANTIGELGISGTGTQVTPATATYAPTVTLSIGNASVTEGNSGTTTLNFPLTLSGTSASPTVVSFTTADGTAVSPTDYVGTTTGTGYVAAGSTTGSAAVTVNGDTSFEPDETFTVSFNSVTPNAGYGSPTSATGTILNDDAAPAPFLTFTVTGLPSGTVCNGVTSTDASTATAFTLHPSLGATSSAAIQTEVNTNAGNGYTLNLKVNAPLSFGTHSYLNSGGTNGAPVSSFAAGSEAIGYTTSDSTLDSTGNGASRFSGSKWAGFNSDEEVAFAPTAADETTCQVVGINQSATTPAGLYNTQLVYTAIPSF